MKHTTVLRTHSLANADDSNPGVISEVGALVVAYALHVVEAYVLMEHLDT